MQLVSDSSTLTTIAQLINGLVIPTLLTDGQRVVQCNAAVMQLFQIEQGVPVELTAVTKYLRRLDEAPLALTEILEESTTKPRRVMVVTPDYNPVLLSMNVVRWSENGDSDWRLITFEPEAVESPESSSLSALNLLRTLNHEFKQPMTSLKAGLFLLKRKVQVSDEVKQKIESMDQHLNQMSRMLTNTVTALKLSQGYLGTETKPVSLENVMEKAVEVVQPSFPHHRFSMSTGSALSAVVDPTLAQQALVQILTNAALYSPAQSVITIALSKEGNQGIISITDSGSGMSVATLERAVEPLTRGLEDQPIPYGMGLGLYIASTIMQQFQGQLTFQSAPGKGTTVHLHFPLG